MSDRSSIEWTDASWNPVRGCTKVSPGCKHCYAETFAERFRGVPGHPYEQGFDLRLVPEKLAEPLSWRKPRRVFVNSMSDLFHEDVPFAFIDRVFATMALAPRHSFQILTKRAGRMAGYFAEPNRRELICEAIERDGWRPSGGLAWLLDGSGSGSPAGKIRGITDGWCWPLPNVWLGVSVEDQQRADERIPHLLRTPAAVRFLSVEPLLGPVNLTPHLWPDVERYEGRPIIRHWPDCEGECEGDCRNVVPDQPTGADGLHWVIVGGESGPGARPCSMSWVESIVRQCKASGLPVFVKQLGSQCLFPNFPIDEWSRRGSPPAILKHAFYGLKDRKGGNPAEWPEALRVREFPAAP